jgi:adenine-specific DNA-methyltransferase
VAQIQFKGKPFVQNHHLLVKYHELVPVKSKSLTKKVSLHDNLIIHGDNLKALKALLPLYAGKVKCIYIDPPYNTGNEKWIYNDNVNSPMMQEWLGKVVDREDLTRHDKWLCMMMPRLRLLKELLSDDGLILVSIDDNEDAHLRFLMDEIFGPDRFVARLIWKSRQHLDSRTLSGVSVDHEYVFAYGKAAEHTRLLGQKRDESKYSNPDKDSRGLWMSRSILGLATKEQRPNLHYSIEDPKTGLRYPCPPDTGWRYSQETMKKKIEDNRILFPTKADGRPREKVFMKELKSPTTGLGSVIDNIFTAHGSHEIREIFGDQRFAFPKPSALIHRLLSQIEGDDFIALDSFAGSGPTAQAVLSLNAEDGGNRRFILIECEDYADSITAERVRRVIKGVPTAKDEGLKKGLGGTFSFFELGKPIELESILDGDDMPSFRELARYVFYTATGEEFDEKKVNLKTHFIGESRNYQVYLFYVPKVDVLKGMAFTLDNAKALPNLKEGKRRLVFAPTKYLDQDHLDQSRIDFAQLPFEIYELTR